MMNANTMKAAVFKGSGIISVESVPIPTVTHSTDVLVKPEAACICGSDMHILAVPPGQRGDPGTIMGHEFVATVLATGSEVHHVHEGDRVVVEPNIHCGVCPECRCGRENLCRDAQNIGQWRDGGFAEYRVVPAKQLHPIPKDMPAKLAALAEPLACVMNGMMRLNPMPHEQVIVFGAGAIGLLFLRVLKMYGVRRVVVCETTAKRREDAKRLGADLVLDPINENVANIMAAGEHGLADAVIDAVGVGTVLEQAIDALKCGGRLLVFGQNMTQRSTIRPGDINNKELTIFATLSTLHSFPPAIEMLKIPSLGIESIITHEFPLSRIEQAIAVLRSNEAIKVLLRPGE